MTPLFRATDRFTVTAWPWPMLLLVLGFYMFPAPSRAGEINSNERYWESEWYYTTSNMKMFPFLVFQDFQTCFVTRDLSLQELLIDEPDDPSNPGFYVSGLDWSEWSIYLNDFDFWNRLQLEEDAAVIKYHKIIHADSHYDYIRCAILIWLVFFCLVFALHTIYFFCLGLLMGTPILWGLPKLYPSVNVYGRKVIITWMVTWRERIRFNDKDAYNEIYRDVFYRVPLLFRRHSSESEPEEVRNLLEPYETYVEPDDEMVELLDESLSDMELDAELWAAVPLLDGGERYEKTRLQKEEETVQQMMEMMEMDPHRKLKEEVYRERMEADAAEELARLGAEAVAYRDEMERQELMMRRKKRKMVYDFVGRRTGSSSSSESAPSVDEDREVRMAYYREAFERKKRKQKLTPKKRKYFLRTKDPIIIWRQR